MNGASDGYHLSIMVKKTRSLEMKYEGKRIIWGWGIAT